MERKEQKTVEMEVNEPSASTPLETATLSDGGASFAAKLAEHKNVTKAYGGILLFAALGGVLALFLAFSSGSEFTLIPDGQTASAEAAEGEDRYADLELEARAVYVYDVAERTELHARNAALQLPLASLTKIMLVLAVSEVVPLDSIVHISEGAVYRGQGGLTWGEEWRARDLIDYTLITSSNTGAEALAEAADDALRAKYPEAPKGGAAVWRMNALAQELGLQETYFINPSGLDESTTQAGSLGSARDIARLFSYILHTNPGLFSGTTRANVAFAPLNFPERIATNTNNALADFAGIIMGKTGTTDLAGGNLALALDPGHDHPIVLVVLGASADGRYADMKKLVARTHEIFR